MRFPLWFLLGFAVLAAGCSSLTTDGHADLGKRHHVWVEQRLNDNLGIGRLLTSELQALGYDAQSGPLTMMPDATELIVTYDAREEWDFRPYLIELNVAVRPAKDYNVILSTARYFHPGITRKTTETMVHELAQKLFPPAKR
jgi:hypothetical protein